MSQLVQAHIMSPQRVQILSHVFFDLKYQMKILIMRFNTHPTLNATVTPLTLCPFDLASAPWIAHLKSDPQSEKRKHGPCDEMILSTSQFKSNFTIFLCFYTNLECYKFIQEAKHILIHPVMA